MAVPQALCSWDQVLNPTVSCTGSYLNSAHQKQWRQKFSFFGPHGSGPLDICGGWFFLVCCLFLRFEWESSLWQRFHVPLSSLLWKCILWFQYHFLLELPWLFGCSPTFVPISLVYNSSTNIFAYIGVDGLGSDDVEIIITFRGTQFDDLSNWILNLNFPEAVPYHDFEDCYVHRGFFEAYWSVREGLELWASQLFSMYPSARITITGHSLGGALASICATELGIIYEKQKNISLWTQESPRVGNQVRCAD